MLSTKQARRKIDQTGKRENQPNRQKTLEKENGQIIQSLESKLDVCDDYIPIFEYIGHKYLF